MATAPHARLTGSSFDLSCQLSAATKYPQDKISYDRYVLPGPTLKGTSSLVLPFNSSAHKHARAHTHTRAHTHKHTHIDEWYVGFHIICKW